MFLWPGVRAVGFYNSEIHPVICPGDTRQAGGQASTGEAQVQLPQQGCYAAAGAGHVPAVPAAGVPGVPKCQV